MKNSIWIWKVALVTGLIGFAVVACGGERPAESPSEEKEAVSEALTQEEESALKDEFELEALEAIDATNAKAEAEKLAAEIEADL